MGPVHTTRNGQRFRYYVTHPKTIEHDGPPDYRISANAIEEVCCELLAKHIAAQVNSVDGSSRAQQSSQILSGNDHRQRRELIIERGRKITIGDANLGLLLNDGTVYERSLERVRHGNEAKLIVGDLMATDSPTSNPQFVVLLKDADRSRALAMSKPSYTLDRFAKLFGRSTERYERLLRLSYLSPSIVSAIVNGKQPAHLTGRFLQNLSGPPLSWAAQEALLIR